MGAGHRAEKGRGSCFYPRWQTLLLHSNGRCSTGHLVGHVRRSTWTVAADEALETRENQRWDPSPGPCARLSATLQLLPRGAPRHRENLPTQPQALADVLVIGWTTATTVSLLISCSRLFRSCVCLGPAALPAIVVAMPICDKYRCQYPFQYVPQSIFIFSPSSNSSLSFKRHFHTTIH